MVFDQLVGKIIKLFKLCVVLYMVVLNMIDQGLIEIMYCHDQMIVDNVVLLRQVRCTFFLIEY